MELWETTACEDGWREKGEGMTGEVRSKARKNMGKEITVLKREWSTMPKTTVKRSMTDWHLLYLAVGRSRVTLVRVVSFAVMEAEAGKLVQNTSDGKCA